MADIELSAPQTDLVDAVRGILKASIEPLTVMKIRERLPAPFDGIRNEELAEVLQRQVAANVLVMCPKYRSGQDRYWDRTLREHTKVLLRSSLEAGPMPWAELRKRFPKYLRHLAESVIDEELARGAIHRHPPLSSRAGFRFALDRPDVRAYAAKELDDALTRLVERGFTLCDVREAFMQLLHEQEWTHEKPDLAHRIHDTGDGAFECPDVPANIVR